RSPTADGAVCAGVSTVRRSCLTRAACPNRRSWNRPTRWADGSDCQRGGLTAGAAHCLAVDAKGVGDELGAVAVPFGALRAALHMDDDRAVAVLPPVTAVAALQAHALFISPSADNERLPRPWTMREVNTAQYEKMSRGAGFVAALDQSGGSTPKALEAYGIGEDEYSSDDEMFDLVQQMRAP